ncbi:MAG: group II intron reverse transcriptase/maturase, partial [Actinobacteria bacterium]|nr:group II intron reverse transcriptase/maturase [Actinomycetota bacterium]
MITQVLSSENMKRAYAQVLANKGAAGIDGRSVNDLSSYLKQHWRSIKHRVESGSYAPDPILGVEIPKSKGKTRLLGIPTVVDRLLQQALHQQLSPIFERVFQEHSYGFRPHRNAHQAIKQAHKHINDGYQDIVDIDLKSFFDEVSHELLMTLIYRRVKCPQTLKLIRKFLRAPIHKNGKLEKQRQGVPQGSPLSPLLSNIILNELDKELTKRGHRYVRYADDFSIYFKSKTAARRVGNSIYLFLRDKLGLPINREKSGIRRPSKFYMLGYGFVPVFRKGSKGQYQLVADIFSLKRLREKIKWITRKTTPMTFDERIAKLNQVMRGWMHYFKYANMHGKLRVIDVWIRRRLRGCIWHDWKKPNRKMKNLMRLGIPKGMAYSWSRTRMGRWAVACSPILSTTITIGRLESRG